MSPRQEAVDLSGEYTVPLQVTKVLPNVENGIGTAVMLRASDKLFAFTAKHCHKDKDSVTINNLKVRPKNIPYEVADRFPHPKLDIVRLRIENIPAIPACNLKQVDEALPIIQGERSYWIMGFPTYVSFDDNGFTGRGVGLAAMLLDADDNKLSLFIDTTPDIPHGMSGGGVWFYRGTGEAFNPLDLRLVGIVSGCVPHGRGMTINAVPSKVIHDSFQPDPIHQYINDLYK